MGTNASVAFVLKEMTKLDPDVTCGGTNLDDEIKELGGDAGVQPLHDGEVILEPGRWLCVVRTTSLEIWWSREQRPR